MHWLVCRKLADTRSMDNRTTLIHYLVALMLESAPGVSQDAGSVPAYCLVVACILYMPAAWC